MSVCLLIIDDGREDFLEETRDYFEHWTDPHVVIHDPEHRLGFAGAIQAGWDRAIDTGCEYVFHVESDFTFHRPPPVPDMVALLKRRPYLAQVALKRQAWNPLELEAGGVVELAPDDFEQKADAMATWTEHRKFWTTNPSVYSTRFCEMGWPRQRRSEGLFTHRLLADPLLRFAYWGGKFDPPLVEHHGQREGTGY